MSRQAPPLSDLFTAEEIAQLRARNGIYGGWLVLHAWVLIAAACYLFVLWPNPLSFVLALMLIGSRQLGLLILMHDGAHNALAKSPGLNRILGQYLSAWPMLADMDIYRRYHLRHHVNTQTEKDPDNILTAHYPITRESLKRKLIRDITGQSGIAQRREQLRSAMGQTGSVSQKLGSLLNNLGPQLASNLVLLVLFALAGHWYLYFLLWLLPMLTWQQLVLRVRNIAEHAVVPDREDVYRNTRTTLASWLERIFYRTLLGELSRRTSPGDVGAVLPLAPDATDAC